MANITDIYPMRDENYTRNRSDLHYRLTVFKIVVYSVVSLLGTIGNGLVIWFCIVRMKKTVTVVWILNLAIADFTFSLTLPFSITYLIILQWPFGQFMCELYWFLFFANMSVSIFQLVVISLDRFVCVFNPVWCENHRKPRLAFWVALTIWTISMAFCLSCLIINGKYGKNKVSCYRKKYIYSMEWVGIIRFTFFFLLPFLIILSCYVAIAFRMRRKSLTTSSRPYKIILTIIIAFFVCWFPYNFFLLFRIFGADKTYKNVLRIGHAISVNLMLINSCINPILYVLIGRDFKQKCCSSLQAMFEKAFTEDMEKKVSKTREGSTGNLELSHINTFKISML
ncbi:chemerin-like receptor 1 [Anomaloglossus baeobatrachus]|uniref:chemerin-like receptor 1 n=1 Tax=Anomaloglossus baeobatrachus TaxID=238106 RepID=UPI003F4FDC23